MASFVSHAQNREDVLLWRALNDVEQGRYIDLGAAEPVTDSVTFAFYHRGWSGINVEPVRTLFDQLQAERPRDINLNIGAGAAAGEQTLHELVGTGLSTFERKEAERLAQSVGCDVRKAKTLIRPMGEVCRELNFDTAHFLKIDVEGMEEQALRGFDFDYCRPWIVLVESTIPNSRVQRFRSWEPLLTRQGYDFALFDGLNRFYLCEQHKDRMSRLSVPVNIFDGYRTAAEFYLERRADAERETKEALEAVVEREQSAAQAVSEAAEAAAREAAHQAELTAQRHHSELQAREQAAEAQLGQLQSRMELEQRAAEEAKQLHRDLLSAHATLEAGYLDLQAQSKAQLEQLSSRMEEERRATEEAKQLHRDLLNAHVALEAGYLDLQAQSKAQLEQLQSRMEEEQRAAEEARQLHGDLLSAHVALEAGYLDLQAQSRAQRDQFQTRMEQERRETEEAKGLYRDLLDAHVALEAGYLDLQAQSKAQQRQLKSSQTATRRAQDHSRRLKGELAALAADLASLKHAHQALNANLNQAVAQLADQSLETERQAQALAGREQALAAQAQALRSAEAQIEDLRADLAESRRQEQARTQQLQWVYESRSWQITAPLRAISRVVRASLRLLARGVFEVLVFLTGPLLRPLLKRRSVFAIGVQIFNRAPALKSLVHGILARRGLLPGLVADQAPLLPAQPLSMTPREPVPARAAAVPGEAEAETEPKLDSEVFARLRERLGPVNVR